MTEKSRVSNNGAGGNQTYLHRNQQAARTIDVNNGNSKVFGTVYVLLRNYPPGRTKIKTMKTGNDSPIMAAVCRRGEKMSKMP